MVFDNVYQMAQLVEGAISDAQDSGRADDNDTVRCRESGIFPSIRESKIPLDENVANFRGTIIAMALFHLFLVHEMP